MDRLDGIPPRPAAMHHTRVLCGGKPYRAAVRHPAGPFDPWPGGGATVFSPNFLCTGKPGNPYLLKVPPPPALGSSSGSGLSGGAIAGIVIGSVAAAALVAALAFFLVRRRRRQRTAAGGDAETGGAGGAAAAKDCGTGPAQPAGSTPGGSKVSADMVPLGSAKESQFGSGSMDSAFAAAAAGPDTDLAQLPADWNTGGLCSLHCINRSPLLCC